MPGLYDIAKLLDLSNIARLDTARSRYNLAFKIAEIAFSNIKEGSAVKQPVQSDQSGDGEGIPDPNGTPSNDDSNDSSTPVAMGDTSDSSSNSNASTTDDIFGGNSTSVTSQQDPNKNVGQDPNVSKTKQNKIDKSFSKQKDFLNGKIVKKKVSKKEKNLLDVLEKSQVEISDVAQDYIRNYGGTGAVGAAAGAFDGGNVAFAGGTSAFAPPAFAGVAAVNLATASSAAFTASSAAFTAF